MITTQQLNRLYDSHRIQEGERLPGVHAFNSTAALAPRAQLELMRSKARKQRREEKLAAEQDVLQAAWESWQQAYQEHRDDVRHVLRTIKPPTGYRRGGTLVAQLSDLHFGALIRRENMVGYSLRIAAQRLRLYAQRILDMQLVTGADRLVVCLTGDLVDSKLGKLRLDKVAHSEGPQLLAMAQGTDLIVAMVEELASSEAFGSISLNGVAGNEARLTEDQAWGPVVAAENLDCLLHRNLSAHFDGSGVECNFAMFDLVIEAEDQRILLTHGHNLPQNMDQRRLRGVLDSHRADFGISGHIHYAYTTSDWARSASLCGEDGYSGDGLRLRGRAGQNLLHLQGGSRSVTVVDLEDPGEIEGYPLATYDGAFGVNEVAA